MDLLFSELKLITNNSRMCKLFLRKFNKNQKKGLQREVRFQITWDNSDSKLRNSSKKVIKMKREKSGSVCSAIRSLKLANFYRNIWSLSMKKSNSRYKSAYLENISHYGAALPKGPFQDYFFFNERSKPTEPQILWRRKLPKPSQRLQGLRWAWGRKEQATTRRQAHCQLPGYLIEPNNHHI